MPREPRRACIAPGCSTNTADCRASAGSLSPIHWPRWLRGRRFSDNVILMARKPPEPGVVAEGVLDGAG